MHGLWDCYVPIFKIVTGLIKYFQTFGLLLQIYQSNSALDLVVASAISLIFTKTWQKNQ